jgi:hypothetical protein
MELQQHEEVKTTTNYWGYRELSANEIAEVGGGGDFSGDGFSGGSDGFASGRGGGGGDDGGGSSGYDEQQAAGLLRWIIEWGKGAAFGEGLDFLYRNPPQYDPNHGAGTYGYWDAGGGVDGGA